MPLILRKGAVAPASVTIRIPPDIEIHCRPLDTPLWCQAEAMAREVGAASAATAEVPDGARMLGLGEYHLIAALADLSWSGWSGISGEDDKPIPFERDLIRPLVDGWWDIAMLWYRKYTATRSGEVAEKNGFGSVAAGTEATAPNIAASAATLTAPVPEASPD